MHYANILSVNRLRIMAHLGFYDKEREERQPVEISLRIYFPEVPACALDDHAKFLDYGALCAALTEWATSQQFRLVEYMGMQCFAFIREYLNAHGYGHLKLWVQFTKCNPPVPGLQAGTSFTHSDVPISSTSFMPAL